MDKWKLVVFDSLENASHEIHMTPERTIDSYKRIVADIIGDPENAEEVWKDLQRIGARYSEWSHATFVLVSYED